MKKTIVTIGLATVATMAVSTTASAQAKKDSKKQDAGYTAIAGGTDYKIVVDKPGTVLPKIGDYMEVNLTISVSDSVIFDTRVAMEGQPAPLQIQETPFSGDLMNTLKFFTEGDSAIVRLSTDSVLLNGGQAAPWMKKGVNQKMVYNLKVVKFQTKEQKQKEDEASLSKQKSIDEKTIKDYLAANKITATKTASGLYYKIDKQGTGEFPQAGQRVNVNYTGMLVGGKKFDSNVDPTFGHVQPFNFNIGQKQVIAGWDEGLTLLKPGGKGTLFIPSALAYGPRAMGADIPANSVLIFEVELVDVTTGIGE